MLDDDDKIMIATLIDSAMKAADADAGKQLDSKLSSIVDAMKGCSGAIDAMGKRLDDLETAGVRQRIDAHRRKADDAPRPEEEPEELAADGYHALADAQSRADDVFITLGKRAPRPLQSENAAIYERRCVRMLKEFSPTWKGKDLDSSFRNDEAFTVVRDQVYREAHDAGMNPTSVEGGTLRMIERHVDGHIHRTFVGDPRSWMNLFAGPVQLKASGLWRTPQSGTAVIR